MAEPTPFAMSKHFSALIGRDVKFEQLPKPVPSQAKQMFGVYKIVPADVSRVVQADLPLLGAFGGALMGLPADSIKERLASAGIEETLRDAIHEVLNVASTVVCTEHRAIFQKMYADPAYFPDTAVDVFRDPLYRSYFKVSVAGYEGGAFSLFG
jgi:hypothetical protein